MDRHPDRPSGGDDAASTGSGATSNLALAFRRNRLSWVGVALFAALALALGLVRELVAIGVEELEADIGVSTTATTTTAAAVKGVVATTATAAAGGEHE